TADQLAGDEHLRDGRPARKRGELLADRRVRKDVDRAHRSSGLAKRLQGARRVTAHDEFGVALHEESDRLAFDDLVDPAAQLGGRAHSVPLVRMRSSWIAPLRSGSANASYTRRCWSRRERPLNRGVASTTWKWSP